jgi:hypothetical protein
MGPELCVNDARGLVIFDPPWRGQLGGEFDERAVDQADLHRVRCEVAELDRHQDAPRVGLTGNLPVGSRS